MRNTIFKNRYTLLLTVLAAYLLILVLEGVITGREAQLFNIENRYFDLNINDLDDYFERRR